MLEEWIGEGVANVGNEWPVSLKDWLGDFY